MKHLLIDSGNTRCKYVYYDGVNFKATNLTNAISEIDTIESVVYSDVSNSSELTKILSVANNCKIKVHKVETSQSAFGIQSAYQNYQTLGVDRWLAILGAELIQPGKNMVIVDAGTAITVDVLNNQNEHLGGWIVPGISTMKSSIVEKAPNVFTATAIQYENFGRSTPNALHSGCINAAIGVLFRSVNLLNKLPLDISRVSKAVVFLTGGDADLIYQFVDKDDFFKDIDIFVENNLVFYGMTRFI